MSALRGLLAVVLSLALAAAPAAAQSLNGIFNATDSTTTSFAPVTANTSITTKPFTVLDANRFGLSWYLVTASGNPSVNVIILQANSVNDTLTEWSNPVTITAIVPPPTTNNTLTTVRGGSMLVLAPSGVIALRIANTGTVTVTPTVRLYAR